MEKIITPFGEIKIMIDGNSSPYSAQKGSKLNGLCPRVLGRYQITVQFIPDGHEHKIACVFEPTCQYKSTPESGERLECQSFYNDSRIKMSIGLECEAGYIGGEHSSGEYDYDTEYLENGMAYFIKAYTKAEKYVFGIAWINDVGWNDPINNEDNRDIETWFGADPTISL